MSASDASSVAVILVSQLAPGYFVTIPLQGTAWFAEKQCLPLTPTELTMIHLPDTVSVPMVPVCVLSARLAESYRGEDGDCNWRLEGPFHFGSVHFGADVPSKPTWEDWVQQCLLSTYFICYFNERGDGKLPEAHEFLRQTMSQHWAQRLLAELKALKRPQDFLHVSTHGCGVRVSACAVSSGYEMRFSVAVSARGHGST